MGDTWEIRGRYVGDTWEIHVQRCAPCDEIKTRVSMPSGLVNSTLPWSFSTLHEAVTDDDIDMDRHSMHPIGAALVMKHKNTYQHPI